MKIDFDNILDRANEKTWKSELVKAAAMYAVIPAIYVRTHDTF